MLSAITVVTLWLLSPFKRLAEGEADDKRV